MREPGPGVTSPQAPVTAGFELSGERAGLATMLRDVWNAAELIRVLASKDFHVRYRRASFGVLWAVALPAFQAVVLALVLPRFVRFDTEGSYLTFVFAGTTAATFFSTTVAFGVTAIVEQSSLSTRVYFPRVVFALANVLANLYGFLPAVAILAIVTLVAGSGGPRILLLVPASVMLALLTFAISSVVAALQVYFRDTRYIVQACLLVLFYLTPIVYPLAAVGALRRFLVINPLTGVVETFQAATVGLEPGWAGALWWTLGWTAVFLLVAVELYRRFDRVFVDLL